MKEILSKLWIGLIGLITGIAGLAVGLLLLKGNSNGNNNDKPQKPEKKDEPVVAKVDVKFEEGSVVHEADKPMTDTLNKLPSVLLFVSILFLASAPQVQASTYEGYYEKMYKAIDGLTKDEVKAMATRYAIITKTSATNTNQQYPSFEIIVSPKTNFILPMTNSNYVITYDYGKYGYDKFSTLIKPDIKVVYLSETNSNNNYSGLYGLTLGLGINYTITQGISNQFISYGFIGYRLQIFDLPLAFIPGISLNINNQMVNFDLSPNLGWALNAEKTLYLGLSLTVIKPSIGLGIFGIVF